MTVILLLLCDLHFRFNQRKPLLSAIGKVCPLVGRFAPAVRTLQFRAGRRKLRFRREHITQHLHIVDKRVREF